MMLRVTAVAAFVCLTVVACNKDSKPADTSAATKTEVAGSGSGNTAPVAAKADPWAGPADTPSGAGSTKLGEKTGDDLAKVDPWGGRTDAPANQAEPPPTLAEKIDVAKLEKPATDKIELKTLGNAAVTGFKVTYNPSKNATHEQFRSIFEHNRVFEQVAEGLNKTIRLPIAVDINTVDCNTINAFYDPNTKRIIVCYELVSYFLGVFKPTAKNDTELGNAVMGALVFSFFHETGHGLIDILDLPAVGREEDSVDQLATLILIAAGDEGVAMALSGAYWFHLQSQDGGHKTPFWDEHAFDGQRFYNILCLIYGSNPQKYVKFVQSGNLPRDRAMRCPEEYAKIHKAWEKLLQPHLTNGAALNIDYKPDIPVAEAPKTTNQDPWGGTPDGPALPPLPPVSPDTPASAITCEQVAQKAAELITVEAEQRARGMSKQDAADLQAKLDAELPAAIEQILAECAKENWSDASRSCVLKSKTLAQATKCQ
ncbi:MAG TPA: DUF4344 domain-containing metallopeptidase [Kofleriaceae bacterium]|nr:DUF4344 domain-containing metallopeptidase [Kofleriaceae bacterium]